jgi:GTP cyclohydrolase I
MNKSESRKRDQLVQGQLDKPSNKHYSGKKMKTDADTTESVTSDSASSGSMDGAIDKTQKIAMAFRTILEVRLSFFIIFYFTNDKIL